jgi:hypothetical protein
MIRSLTLISLGLVATTAVATAQPAPDAGGAIPAPPEVTAAPTAAPPPPAAASGARLRNGFSLSIGQEFGTSSFDKDYSGQLYGVDWRIGAQVSDALGVYLHSHLSLGSIRTDNVSGYTGNFATALTGEYTLPMRLFVGAGVGYGVLNNPSGPLVGVRVGYYPFAHTGPGKARRLNVALDTRLYFVSAGGESITMKHIAVSIGYDRL